MLQPVLAPRVEPVALPFAALPYLQNSPSPEGREAGNSAVRFPAMQGVGVRPVPPTPPSPEPKPDEVPLVAPVVVIHNGVKPLSPAAQAALRLNSGTHKLRRPPKGTKELKARTVSAFQAVSPYINPLTEAVDVINAIYKNLPEQYRPRYKNTNLVKIKMRPDEKLVAIFNNFDKIDIVGALQDIAISQAEDKAYGLAGKTGGEVSRALGKPVGAGINKVIGNLPKF